MPYAVKDKVKVNTGQVGEVLEINPDAPLYVVRLGNGKVLRNVIEGALRPVEPAAPKEA